jgi:hypothetical protein
MGAARRLLCLFPALDESREASSWAIYYRLDEPSRG